MKKIATVEFEMTIKVLLNILYLLARELTKEDLDLYNRGSPVSIQTRILRRLF